MESEIIDKHVLDTSSSALIEKLNFNWILLNSNSNDWACSSNGISQQIPTKAELCLLICSLFPEDYRVPIDDLVIYGMALKVFEDVHNMIEARYRVHNLIEIINLRLPPCYLNKLCLWEDKYGNQYVKVLSNAFDLAQLIASKYQSVFNREIVKRRWPVTNLFEYFHGLSLVLNLGSPRLALLQLQHREDSQSIPIDTFKGIKELLVLSLEIPSLQWPLNVLCNLRTLRIHIPKLENMAWIGCFVNLELLSVSTLSLTDIPEEMGQLGELKFLDLRKMNIAYIPPAVLSKMLKLEELYLPLSFQRWGCRAKELDDYDEMESWEEDDQERIGASINRINDEERINASISDIVSLSLHALQISIPQASILPKKSSMFKTIQQFKIFVPNNLKYKPPGKLYSSNVLQLTGDAYVIKESGICDLMSRTTDLNLTRVRNLKNVICELEDYGFPQLEKMIISECDELEYVIDATNDCLFSKLEILHLSILSSLKEICNGRWTKLQCFQNLSQISIRFCHKLKYVFPLSIFKGCARLKSIEILNCNEMEGILYQDEENDNPHVQYFIEELDLHLLPKLVGFLVHNEVTMDRVHDGTDQLTTNEVSPIKNDDKISRMEMYNAFSSKLTSKWLQNLKRLKIASCEALEVIFLFEEENQVTSRAFNSLKELELYYLPNLIHVWFSVPLKINGFQNLQLLVLSECQNLYLFSPRVANFLVQLQKVYISRCENMEEVIMEDEKETENKIVFPQLKLLELQHMPNLRIFSSGIYTIQLPSMESLAFNQCSKMKSFSYGSLWTPMLKRIQINGSLYPISGDLNATIERYMKGNCDDIPSNNANPSSTISSNSLSNFPKSSYKGPRGPKLTSLGSSNDSYNQIISVPTSQCSVAANEESNLYPLKKKKKESNLYVEILEWPNYMKEFTFADLRIATRNFSSDNLLGEGGFGGVYKGWLEEKTFAPSKTGTGVAIAIKKLMKPNSGQWLCQWQTEVEFLERQSHPNLVKYLGYCSEDGELLLVYEFIPGGNLLDNICRKNPLSWITRIKVAIGVARGLNFLHTLKQPVIHRDIKSKNILFDRDYNGKIIDFGLAKWGPSNWDSHATTMSNYVNISELDPLERPGPSNGDSDLSSTVKGTFGYLDPAYFRSGRLSVKSDVYSFGVVLLELMTGLRALDKNRRESQRDLVLWWKPILSNERQLKSIMDSRMKGQCSSEAMLLLAKLVSKCTNDDPIRRPTSGQVLEELLKIYATKQEGPGLYGSGTENESGSSGVYIDYILKEIHY